MEQTGERTKNTHDLHVLIKIFQLSHPLRAFEMPIVAQLQENTIESSSKKAIIHWSNHPYTEQGLRHEN